MKRLTELLTVLIKQKLEPVQRNQQCNYANDYYGDQVCKLVANQKQ